MSNRSKLLKLRIRNVGCIGDEAIEIALDSVVCLVGKNNAGKSTILRAYELAQGKEKFDAARDRCAWALEGAPSEIELDVHIPKGVSNISEDWKIEDNGHLILRSKWTWSPQTDFSKVRTTWNPSTGSWSEDEKAAGADNVFTSRLPRPIRIGSLDDANETEALLLKLALDPLFQEIKLEQLDETSELHKSVKGFVTLIEEKSVNHKKRFDEIAENVQMAFAGVFPGLELKLNVAMNSPAIQFETLLQNGSGIKIKDGKAEASLIQQGTGSRRALFWSMLRVHNELKRGKERRDKYRSELVAQIKKEKNADTKAQKEAQLAAFDEGGPLPDVADDLTLPGYLLLIDEPENALHPMAARAAQKHLYQLADDPDWQVMMTTHSPYFINPLADHTTIVRLERSKDDVSPIFIRTYISDEIKFSDDERTQLQALQQMDASFSEVFFGSYPILVEGDTEHAAFVAAVIEEGHDLADQVTIVRARGKAILTALIRMMEHFKIGFGIVHDTDWPYNKRGANGMWTVNVNIYKALNACRNAGLKVRHRFSVPDFERRLGGEEIDDDKPFEAYRMIRKDQALKKQVQELMKELLDGEDHGPGMKDKLSDDDYMKHVLTSLNSWARDNNQEDDPRLLPPEKKEKNGSQKG